MSIEVILCDADGTLFPSEEPAFEASAVVTNRMLEELGIAQRYAPDELRRVAMGRSFRATAAWLAAQHGAALEPAWLERYVETERTEVMAHLGRVLKPDPAVLGALDALREDHRLAVVSSSALARLAVCFTATGLDPVFEADVRFSAEDSLELPTSKPDPAVYAFAAHRLGVDPGQALAIEDAVSGVQSAVTAGVPVVGNLHFVPESERDARAAALSQAGAVAVCSSWEEVVALTSRSHARRAASGA
jgi:HAD superfamily hydrolase (TIGR01509 family)